MRGSGEGDCLSRHIPRSARWSSCGPAEWRSVDGLVVHFTKRAWWADIAFRLQVTEPRDERTVWEAHAERLGPFKRSRNAMVEADRYVILLRNRHGEKIVFDGDGTPK